MYGINISVKNNAAKGFTILELLIVILLIGMTSSLAGAAYNKWNKTDIRFVASKLKSELRFIRSQAVLKSKGTEFTLNVENKSYKLSGKNIVKLPEDMDISFRLDKNNTLKHEGKIFFYADGTSSGGEIEFKQGSRKLKLIIYWLNGMIEII